MKEQTNVEVDLEIFKRDVLDSIIKIFSISGLCLLLPLLYVDNFSLSGKNSFVYFIIILTLILNKVKDKLSYDKKVVLFFLLVFSMVSEMMYHRGLYSTATFFIIVISALLPLFLNWKNAKIIFFIFLSLIIFCTYWFSQNMLFTEIQNNELHSITIALRGVVLIISSFIAFTIIEFCNELLKKNYSLLKKKNEKLKYYHTDLEKTVIKRTKELELALIREQEAGMLKTNFISMASHEFRTPLASIQGVVELILNYSDRITKEQLAERLEKVQVEVGTMTAMLEDVLVISNGGAGNKSFNPIKIDFVPFVKNIIFEYQLFHKDSRKVDFECLDAVVNSNVDPKLMKQVVVNLFSNALKYSESPSPILIRVFKEKDDVVFSISDQGIGISKQDQKMIFEPFYRASNIENVSGTGLGLAIVKQVVALHNGKIQIQSELGKGTTFTVAITQIN